MNSNKLILFNNSLVFEDLCRAIDDNPGELFRILQAQGDELSESERNNLILVAIRRDSSLFGKLANKYKNDSLCKEVISIQPLALEHIPFDMRNFGICDSAVCANWKALKDVPFENLTIDQYKYLCLKVLKQSCEAFLLITTKELVIDDFIDLCLKAVAENGLILKYITKNPHQQLRDKEFLKICKAAVLNNPSSLEFVPGKFRDFRFYLALVERRGDVLKFIPFSLVGSSISADQYKELCVAAVKNSGSALEYVNQSLRRHVITTCTPEKILREDCSMIDYFDDSYELILQQFLENLEYIVITEENLMLEDHEIKDMYLVYANSEKRKEKITAVRSSKVKALLEMLKEDNKKQLNLILLDHATKTSEIMSFLQPNEIAQLLRKYPQISRVTLLGCNTLKAKKLDCENEMIERFRKANATAQPCDLILTAKKCNPALYPEILKQLDTDRAFIVVQNPKQDLAKETSSQAQLFSCIYITRNIKNPDQINEKLYTITKDQMRLLKILINKIKLSEIIIDGQRFSIRHLENMEIDEVFELLEKMSKFDKKHPQHKQFKNDCPFLQSATLFGGGLDKLKTSFAEKLVKAIKAEQSQVSSVVIKGYTKGVYVNTRDQVIHVTRTYPYKQEYTDKKTSTFYNRLNNIDPKKLRQERKNVTKTMSNKEKNNTQFKAIKISMG